MQPGRFCFAAPVVLCSTRDRALQPGVVLCSARKGQRRGVCALGHQVVLCSTRRDGGNRGGCALQRQARGVCALEHQVLLCSTSGDGGEQGGCALQRQGRGEERGLCFGAPGIELCSTRKDGGEERRGALRQGRGEERGLCFAAPEGMDGNKGVVLCSARGGEGGLVLLEYKVLCSMRGDGGEQGVCALQHQGRGEERGLCF